MGEAKQKRALIKESYRQGALAMATSLIEVMEETPPADGVITITDLLSILE